MKLKQYEKDKNQLLNYFKPISGLLSTRKEDYEQLMNLIWDDYDIHKTEIEEILEHFDKNTFKKKEGKAFHDGLVLLQSLLIIKTSSNFKKDKKGLALLKRIMKKLYEPFIKNFGIYDLSGLFSIIDKLISQGLKRVYSKCMPVPEPLHSLCYVYFKIKSTGFADSTISLRKNINIILNFHKKLAMDDCPNMAIVNLLISYFTKISPEEIHLIWKFIYSKDYFSKERNNDWLLETYSKLVPLTPKEKLGLVFNKNTIKFLYNCSQDKNSNILFYESFVDQINKSLYPEHFPSILLCLIINESVDTANILFVMNKLINSLASKISNDDIHNIYKLNLDEKPLLEHFRITSCYYLLKNFLSTNHEAIKHFSFRCIEIYSESGDAFYLSHFKLSIQFFCNIFDVEFTPKIFNELMKLVAESIYNVDPLPILNQIKELFDGISSLKESMRYVFSLTAFASICYEIESEELVSSLLINLTDAVCLKNSRDPSWAFTIFEEILSLSIVTYKSGFQVSKNLLNRLSKHFNMTTLDIFFRVLEDPTSVISVNNEKSLPIKSKAPPVPLVGEDIDISELDPEQASQIDEYLSQALGSIKKNETNTVSDKSIAFVQNRIFGLLTVIEKNLKNTQTRFEISFRLLKLSSSKFFTSNKEQFEKIKAVISSFLSHSNIDGECDSEWVVGLMKEICRSLKSQPVICFNESWAEIIIKLTQIISKLDDANLAKESRKPLKRMLRIMITRFMSTKRESINPNIFDKLYYSIPRLCKDRRLVMYFFSEVGSLHCAKFKHDKLVTYWRYFMKHCKKSSELFILEEIIKIIYGLTLKKVDKRNLTTIETVILTCCRRFPSIKTELKKLYSNVLPSATEGNALQVKRVLKKLGL